MRIKFFILICFFLAAFCGWKLLHKNEHINDEVEVSSLEQKNSTIFSAENKNIQPDKSPSKINVSEQSSSLAGKNIPDSSGVDLLAQKEFEKKFTAANTAFTQEKVDENWANDHRVALKNFFASEPILQGVELKEIECRSSSCKISFHSSSKDYAHQIVSDFGLAILKKQRPELGNKFSLILFDKNSETALVYMSNRDIDFLGQELN